MQACRKQRIAHKRDGQTDVVRALYTLLWAPARSIITMRHHGVQQMLLPLNAVGRHTLIDAATSLFSFAPSNNLWAMYAVQPIHLGHPSSQVEASMG